MRTLKIVYPSIVDIGCFSHTIDGQLPTRSDLVGKHFKVPHAYELLTSWMALFSHSYKAKIAWGEQTGKAMPSYSATRWWSKWEILDQLLVSFGDIKLFLTIILIWDQLHEINYWNSLQTLKRISILSLS